MLKNFAAIPQEFLWTFNTEDCYDEKLFYGVKLSQLQIHIKDQAMSQGLIDRTMYGDNPLGDYVYFAPSGRGKAFSIALLKAKYGKMKKPCLLLPQLNSQQEHVHLRKLRL